MRLQHLKIWIVAAVLLAFSGCMPAKFTEIPALTGRVVGFDGQPVPGAIVGVSRKPATPGHEFTLTIESDNAGEFHYGGQQRWVMWIIFADVFPEAWQVQARRNGSMSQVCEVESRTEVHVLGPGKPRYHDVGELRLPSYVASP